MSFRRRLSGDAVELHAAWRSQQGLAAMSVSEQFWSRAAGLMVANPRIKIRVPECKAPFWIRANSSDEYVFEQIYRDREYAIQHPTPLTLVDAGANVGLATILFANRFPEAEIIAVEPDAENFSLLQQNVRDYPNVRCVRAGIWHRRTTLSRLPDDAKPWAYRFEENPAAGGIDAITLDDVAAMFSSGRIDLAKIDIEGAEKEVFDNPGDWMRNVETVLVETHDRMIEGSEASVRSAFNEAEFDGSQQGENLVFIRRTSADESESPNQ